jgi:predicted aldo/keto reductase-like oxidoreductase
MKTRYNPKTGDSLSILGFGCMRFPRRNGRIDQKETERLLVTAIENGVNYLDTAWIYPGSEETIGRILKKNSLREKVFIATKLPHYLMSSLLDIEHRFEEQLSRLQSVAIDYYLIHMLPDIEIWERLCALGIQDWIAEKKKTGQIGKIGFSYHGSTEAFVKLIDAYDWDFCQIQYNYVDENTQAGRRGLQYAASKGMAIIIMEPLRGGRLANALPQGAQNLFLRANSEHSFAAWAFLWLFDQPEVTCVLSGMNTPKMLAENLKTAGIAGAGMLTEKDHAIYENVKKELMAQNRVECTGCGYCVPCPHGVDIPGCFRAYNASYSDGLFVGMKEYLMCTTFRRHPSNASRCIGCGVCEERCPQKLAIREDLKSVSKRLENPVYRLASIAAKRFAKF